MSRLRRWWYCWGPFAFRYQSLGTIGWTYGLGWRRWVLYHYSDTGFSWCNYFGEGEGG